MRWVMLLASATAFGQSFDLKPAAVRQGETVRVSSAGEAESARMNGRTVRLFTQPEGARLGLMPVPVDERPGKYPVEFVAKDGEVLHTATVTVLDARYPRQNIILGKAQQALKPSPGEMETVAAFRRNVSADRHWEEAFVAPVAGCMSSLFGVRRLYNGRYSGNFHSGVDQRAPAGQPIRAFSAGVVKLVRDFNIHGGTVGIDHGQGLQSIYLHMSGFAVKEGQAVRQGDVIGYIGSTGRSTAPHLHWSLYANGVPVSPLQWVKLKTCAAPVKTRRKTR